MSIKERQVVSHLACSSSSLFLVTVRSRHPVRHVIDGSSFIKQTGNCICPPEPDFIRWFSSKE